MTNFHKAPATYVGEVLLNVQNLPRSVDFYKEVIGFQVLEQTAYKASFTVDGKTPILTVQQPNDVAPKQVRATGLYHFALLLPSRADLGSILKHFIDKKVRLQGASDHLVSEALYLADPDGNGIEIYSDRSASDWKWHGTEVEMASVALDAESILEEAAGKQWTKLPNDTKMGHIHLHVSDLKEAEEFYTKVLGFDVVTRYGGQALFISTERYHHHIGLNTWNGIGAPIPAPNSVGLEWYTLVYPTDKKRIAAVEALQAHHAPLEKINEAYFTQDPSGNRLKLV
ncbi:VOC family protein [Sutcliffiella rhizosphaerae]|uniref:Catechol-2,3-dioxygenase n=1 Tax=Sutcliffiella rhizosphaerae TaxID=2880967 RepID=A0ABM8YPG0_9BACI|nr:VOC family protein [Sutcliffiella rhizosphaerae]CAG9621802.1 Catechol-2,3-dioxygenase [Sutcliffiella rhizosphaerae]